MPSGSLDTPIGPVTVLAEAAQIRAIRIGGAPADPEGADALVREALAQLEAWFARRLSAFDLPLAPARTAAGQRLRDAIAAVPRGTTRSYGAVAAIRDARERAGGRKVGVVGYCLGGRMAWLAAARTDSDASVGYYGGGIDAALGEAHAIANPVLLHFAEQDHFIDADARAKIHTALEGVARVTIHDYPDVDHGFATSFGSRRDEAAATLADARTAAFFAEHIG